MCGIVGIVTQNAALAPELLERATASLSHRGPDDAGTVILRAGQSANTHVGLGNCRLAILDLTPLGHQPMHDPETGNWIAYNGEIYNFRQIRDELSGAGTQFAGHSDTEVLLKAYARWGDACLDKLRGMFAFALWDAARERLLLARDPMGIKPLYYFAGEGFLAFASEVRTLLGTGLVPRRLDRAGLWNYLSFGSVYDPATLVEGGRALPPGTWMAWEQGATRQQRYWDLGAGAQPQPGSGLRDLLEETARMQMVSDVPVGVFLSGGIDSSSLVALVSGAQKVSTFSVVFREADFSEARFSREVARKFVTDHHEILLSQRDALESIPGAIAAMDQPTMDGINTYVVSRHTRAAGIKVTLSGLGGDEIFAGYDTFRTVPRMESFFARWRHLPAPFRAGAALALGAIAPASDQNRKLEALARADDGLLHPYFLSRMLFTPRQCSRLMPADAATRERAAAPLREALERTRGMDPVNRVSYLETRCYMLNTLLRDSDVMSMAHGLEVRVPLMDHRLAEAVFAIPGARKLSPGMPKPLLVGALGDALPGEIVHRRKRGFTLPFERWMREDLRQSVLESLDSIGSGALGGVLHAPEARRTWDQFEAGRMSWSRPWALHVLHCWCEKNL